MTRGKYIMNCMYSTTSPEALTIHTSWVKKWINCVDDWYYIIFPFFLYKIPS